MRNSNEQPTLPCRVTEMLWDGQAAALLAVRLKKNFNEEELL